MTVHLLIFIAGDGIRMSWACDGFDDFAPRRYRVNIQEILKWSDVLNLAKNGRLAAIQKIVKKEGK
jgi:hypothetical protein